MLEAENSRLVKTVDEKNTELISLIGTIESLKNNKLKP